MMCVVCAVCVVVCVVCVGACVRVGVLEYGARTQHGKRVRARVCSLFVRAI